MITTPLDATPEKLSRELASIAGRLKLGDVSETLRFPKFVFLETVRLCNARCPFCPQDQWDKSVPFMSDELFERVVGQLAEHRDWLIWVNLQKSGEPLLDPKIGPRVARLKEAGIRHVTMSTNASLLDEAKARELLTAGLDQLMISIDSVQRESYEKMRIGLDYDTALGNIRRFFRLRDEIAPHVSVRVRAIAFMDETTPDGREEMAAWEHFWDGLRKPHDRIYMKKPHNWANQMHWDDKIDDLDWVYHPCILPWSTMSISTDGSVPLCGEDFDARNCLGDAAAQTLEEIWRGEGFARIRQLHASGQRNQVPFCQGCRLWDDDQTLEQDREERLAEVGVAARAG